MKLIVETVGPVQFHSFGPDQFARHDRPSVVSESNFMSLHIHNGEIKILAQVADTASDKDFLDQWKECGDDPELAISNYVSQHPLNGVAPEEAVAPKKRAPKA